MSGNVTRTKHRLRREIRNRATSDSLGRGVKLDSEGRVILVVNEPLALTTDGAIELRVAPGDLDLDPRARRLRFAVPLVKADGSVPLSRDWDNSGRRLRHTGVAEVTPAAPPDPAVGLVWLDTGQPEGGLGQYLNVVSVSADYTLAPGDDALLVDATFAMRTITVPSAVGVKGKLYSVAKDDPSAFLVRVQSVSPILGAGFFDLTAEDETVSFFSDGAEWHIR